MKHALIASTTVDIAIVNCKFGLYYWMRKSNIVQVKNDGRKHRIILDRVEYFLRLNLYYHIFFSLPYGRYGVSLGHNIP